MVLIVKRVKSSKQVFHDDDYYYYFQLYNRLYFLSQKDQCNHRNTGLLFNQFKNRCYDEYLTIQEIKIVPISSVVVQYFWCKPCYEKYS